MSLIDKQMFLKDLASRIGSFITADDVHRIMIAADEALIEYQLTRAPDDGGPDSDSDDLVEYFLDAMRVEGKSEKTVERYRYVLNRLLKDTGIPVRRMNVYNVRNYCTTERARGISLTTLEGYRSIYRSFFGWLDREGLISGDPMKNLTAIKRPKVIRKPFSQVDIAKLREAASDPRDRAILEFLLSTGCRISEACSVRREDIDYQSLRLTVLGKGAKERAVYIDDVTAMFLKRYLETRTDSDPALFFGRKREPLKPGGVRAMLNRLARQAGVDNVHPHRFRRTLATSLIDKGMPIQEVAAILGHEKIDTTMGYIYIDERNVANAYRKYA